MPSRASSSARSFSTWPACPRTQCQCTSWRVRAASSRCHRSAFLTGVLSAVLQPLRFQPWIHSLMPFLTYSESVCRSTREGLFSASSAEIAAISSMRLLVVAASPPQISLRCVPEIRIAPQPPGPGFPEQAPSV